MSGTHRRKSTAVAVVAVLAAAGAALFLPDRSSSSLVLVRPGDDAVAVAEGARAVNGAAVRRVTLTAAPTSIRVAGRVAKTWAFNGTVPGPTLRAVAGDTLQATVVNRLPEPLAVHWHGIALRNDMDGVNGLTQQPILSGETFTYSFVVPTSGTYWYHPHTALQLDRGLYGALVVDERPPAPAVRDIPVLLDDWTDGLRETPEQVLQRLGGTAVPHSHLEASSMPMGGSGSGGSAGDVDYPAYLVDGRSPEAPTVYDVQPGERVRLRLINAASDTAFLVGVLGVPLTVVATDGYPVTAVTQDLIPIAMGERYDVELTAPATGWLRLAALAEGKTGYATALIRVRGSSSGSAPAMPRALTERRLQLSDLGATDDVLLPEGGPDRTYRVTLTGTMTGYSWGIDAPKEGSVSMPVRQGERVRLVLSNATMMSHPVHLHGHTFQVGPKGPRKDTVLAPPMGRATIDLVADNPGQWMLHCHNLHHAATGMTALLSYVR